MANMIDQCRYYIHRVRSLSAGVVFRRVCQRLHDSFRGYRGARRDIRLGTYLKNSDVPNGQLLRYIGQAGLGCRPETMEADVIENYLNHRFNLLGSGWRKAGYGVDREGLGGVRYRMGLSAMPDPEGTWLCGRVTASNLAESRRTWAMIEQPYEPIDWHLDLRSGYRWSPLKPSCRVAAGSPAGADIKGPWELSRMQHLPQIALACAGAQDDLDRRRCAREFRNQILDFLATNPPRFGVNWACTMDVGIRLVNWLLAWDLWHAAGEAFAPAFERRFFRGVYEHCLHIASHLEWHENLRENHYLSGIAGLLFGAGYLPRTPVADAWLGLSVQELIASVSEQFQEDGSNFEGSTSYHCLSSQIVAFSTALVLGLPHEKRQALMEYDRRMFGDGPPVLAPSPIRFFSTGLDEKETPFPPWYVERLERMRLFTAGITRGDGQVPQIGDNDSGRFVKFSSASAERFNDHCRLIRAIGAILEPPPEDRPESEASADAGIIRQLSAGTRLAQAKAHVDNGKANLSSGCGPVPAVMAWRDFGLYVLRTEEAYLAIRCGSIGQKGRGGHAHNDQLSFELALNGRAVLVDTGTYVYTPDLKQRNHFRSTAMHNTFFARGKEQNSWPHGLPGAFRMYEKARAQALEIGPGLFRGAHPSLAMTRELRLIPGALCGTDRIESDEEKWASFHFAPEFAVLSAEASAIELAAGGLKIRLSGGPGAWICEEDLYSPSYGIVQPALVVRLATSARRVQWEVSWRLK